MTQQATAVQEKPRDVVQQVEVGADALSEREQQLQEATGESTMTRIALDFSRMMNEGLMMAIHSHNLGIFKRTATWEQLGIRPDDQRRSRLGKGHQKLAPRKIVNKLASFETRIRSNLDHYSFQIKAFGSWRWLPLTAYEEWKERHEELVSELYAYIQETILDKWEEIEQANRDYFERIAERAWNDWQANRDAEGYDEAVVIVKGRGVYTSKEDAVVRKGKAGRGRRHRI